MSAAPVTIPQVTADLVIATSVLGTLANAPMRRRCAVVQAVVDNGKSLDEMSVLELVQLAQGVNA